MSKRFARYIAAVLAVASFGVVTFIVPSSASANSVQRAASATTTTTTTTSTTLTIPAAQCAQLKAQYPKQASNPRLCRPVHVETLTLSRAGGLAAPQSCWSGTASFNDQYVEAPGVYSMQLNSTFTYSCSVPTSVRLTNCNLNWEVLGWTVSNSKCWGYSTSLPSRAAYEQWLATQPLGSGAFTAWQRRECYKGVPTGSCSWYWG